MENSRIEHNKVTLYNPAEKKKEFLKDEFVVRNNSFETVFAGLQNQNPQTPLSHYLIVGQRGAGKTTLLYRLKYSIEDDPQLRHQLIPVNFSEEQYHINSLNDLWESLAEILEDYHEFRKLSSKVTGRTIDNQDGERCFEILATELTVKQKRVVLFIDNFGELLRKLSSSEILSLRDILTTSRHLQVIAGTPITLESVLDSSQISFDFFRTVELKGLDNDETKTLLLKLAEIHGVLDKIEKIIKDRPQRIEILRRLTGGVIRTMVLLFKIFIETEDGRSVRDLQLILDSVTPLYKHRMDELPAQQQKIVDVVAKNWDAISVKEITLKSKIPSKVVSAQLRQLEKNQVISKVSTDSKNNLYQLRERFLNIWYLMRYGRRYDKKRVTWLIRFFEAWCNKQELEERIKQHIENLQSDKYDANSAVLIGEAYVGCNTVDRAIKEKLIETTGNLYPKEFDVKRFNLDDDLVKEAQVLFKDHNIQEALLKLDALQNLTDSNYRAVVRIAFEANDFERVIRTLKMAEEKGFASKADLHFMGGLFEKQFKNYEQSLEYYNKAKSLGFKSAIGSIAKLLYRHLGKADESEKIYLALLHEDPTNADVYHELGHLYAYHKKDYETAINSFKRSIELGRSSSNYCLGAVYHYELKDFEMAKLYYSNEASGENSFSLGRLYMDLTEDFKTAIEYFEKAVKEKILDSFYYLGKIYEEMHNNELAIRYYDLAYKEANIDHALHRLGHLYSRDKATHKEAEKYFKLAIEKGDNYAIACLARFYFENKVRRKEAEELIGRAKIKLPSDPYIFEVSANIMFWADKFDLVVEDLSIVLQDEKYVEDELKDITSLIIRLLAKKQYKLVLRLFENQKTKDMMKPTYFALMTLMKEDFPNESLKMGEEMAETVSEIIHEIKGLEKK